VATSHFRRFSAPILIVAVAGGCSSHSALLPSLIQTTQQSASVAAPQTSVTRDWATVRFRIPVPGRTDTHEAHRVFPAYVSASTSKIEAIVRGLGQSKASKQSFPCTAVCTGKIVAPIGPDVLTLRLEDSHKRVLSQGTATILVFKKKNNVFNFTLDGVPARVSLAPTPAIVPVTPASTGYILFNALDANGNIITPDGDYANAKGQPLVFDAASNNASFRLGVTTISSPGTMIPFTYDGTQHVGTVTLTPSAHPGVSTHVTFHASTVTLVPGIATRIAPPLPVQVLSATQVPFPNSAGFDPNAIFVLGNSGGQSAALAFDTVTGAYGISISEGSGAPYMSPPVDQGNGNGFYGFTEFGNNLWGSSVVHQFSAAESATGAANPCSTGNPIGEDNASTRFCQYGFFPGSIYDDTHSTFVATGQDRKIEAINGVDYFGTANDVGGANPGLNVYAAGSTTAVAGAISVGADVTLSATGFYGESNGTVTVIGGSTVATFSHPVESVIGSGTTIYAYENGGIFGVSGASGKFESQPLPIGAVVDVVTGVNGAPMLVESDGTLDVMGI
jgi:hypothetical protein